MPPETPPPIRLLPRHIDAAAEVFARSFCEREPLTVRLGVGLDVFRPFAREVATRAAADGLSAVVEGDDGAILAVAFAEDLASPLIVSEGAYAELVPVFRLLEGLSAGFLAGDPVAPRRITHIWIIAVAAHAAGRGLSTRVTLGAMKLAEDAGYTHAFTEFTNPLTEQFMTHIPAKMLVGVAVASTLEIDGRRPFAGLDSRAAAYLWPLRAGDAIELPRVR